ncbi:MAG: hypothetical protein K2P67_10005 [Gallionellaceae bacterium]|jgi:hypothetical protein|nr:hypothetical protein [Gallionellaceae bacterium]
MKDIVLYCKSYHRDVQRAKRLAESIRKHNAGNLPFYLSCPSSDLALFRDTIGSDGVTLLADEEIVAANTSLDQQAINALPGGISQQIVKSEFWRLGICENYLCIDSDAYFIHDFSKENFLTPGGAPYTVMNESLELRLFGVLHQHARIARDRDTECKAIMEIFGRTGRPYDFGPLPVVWSRHVWADLAEKFLEPQNMNFLDAMALFPSEMRWYGEALLKYRSIELWPVETLFRCYHYEQQFLDAKKSGETDEALSRIFLGVCSQSNWDKTLDHGQGKKSLPSRLVRTIKRRVFKRLT